MSLPTKTQTVRQHLPQKGGVGFLTEDGDLWSRWLRGLEYNFRKKGDNLDFAIFQYTGRDPREALSFLQEAILKIKPGAPLIVDGYVRQKSLIRASNKALICAVNAALTLQMIEEVIQVDFEAGDGIFIGATSE